MSPLSKKAAIIGWPARHSLSPILHGFWRRHYGIEGAYEAMPTPPENLIETLRNLAPNGFCGANLTIPHKQIAYRVMDGLDDAARQIGAVNLVVAGQDGSLYGRNTDAYGFTQNLLTSGYKPNGGKALVLGAGGAARAVIVALITMGFKDIRIANRTLSNADILSQEFSTPLCPILAVEWAVSENVMEDVDLLVNTTSLGMAGQPELEIALDRLPTTATVTDIVYTPLQTGLLRHAQERGHATIDGLGMLLHQARPSFHAFFGYDPEVTSELRDFVIASMKQP